MILVLGQSRSHKVPNLSCKGPESPGWFNISQKKPSALDVMHEWTHCFDEAANHQWLIAANFWVIWIVFLKECSGLMQNLMQICCFTCSVLLNVMATQYTCSLNLIYYLEDDTIYYYSEVVIVHACSFQSTLFGCQVTLMSCKSILRS